MDAKSSRLSWFSILSGAFSAGMVALMGSGFFPVFTSLAAPVLCSDGAMQVIHEGAGGFDLDFSATCITSTGVIRAVDAETLLLTTGAVGTLPGAVFGLLVGWILAWLGDEYRKDLVPVPGRIVGMKPTGATINDINHVMAVTADLVFKSGVRRMQFKEAIPVYLLSQLQPGAELMFMYHPQADAVELAGTTEHGAIQRPAAVG